MMRCGMCKAEARIGFTFAHDVEGCPGIPYGFTAEARACPEHSDDPVACILGPRTTYTGRCPVCGKYWN